MKIQIIQFIKIIISHSEKLLVSAATLATLSACVSLDTIFQPTLSPLPFESIHTPSGRIASVRAFESNDKLFVAGSVQISAGYAIHYAAHVDIQLISKDGQVLAEKQDNIDAMSPHRKRTLGNHYSYAASFPLNETRQAAKIRVTYHSAIHAHTN